MSDEVLLASLLSAVERAPDDVALRVHVACVLMDAGRPGEALAHCAAALVIEPGHPGALVALVQATSRLTGGAEGAAADVPLQLSPKAWRPARPRGARAGPSTGKQPNSRWRARAAWAYAAGTSTSRTAVGRPAVLRTEAGTGSRPRPGRHLGRRRRHGKGQGGDPHRVLVPMANPALRAAHRSTLGGGLLMYGPPGCGKTFLARAVAGELGVGFVAVSLADVLDMWLGQSERDIKGAVRLRVKPCPGGHIPRRGRRHRPTPQQPAQQPVPARDGEPVAGGDGRRHHRQRRGVHPGCHQPALDLDLALRRPGRFDRVLFVPPPDAQARTAILRYHMAGRPLGPVDFDQLAVGTDGYSGADLAHMRRGHGVALADAAARGQVRPVTMADLETARRQVRPTTAESLSTPRTAATFANSDGTYDDLAEFLKRKPC